MEGKIQLAIYVNNSSFLEEMVLQVQDWMQGDQLESCLMAQIYEIMSSWTHVMARDYIEDGT